MPAEHVPLAQELPAVYQADATSFAQLDGYLGLVDEVLRTCAEELAELGSWLSPAGQVWPPGLPVDAGAPALHDALVELYDVLAGWSAFRFPGSWRTDAEGMARRREYVARAARVWRRRGTPRGFLDWFCLCFGVRDPQARPVLLEHFKYGEPAAGEPGLPPGLRATLLVPTTAPFREYATRVEAAAFVARYAPSHVLVRLCWREPPVRLPDPPAAGADATEYRRSMRALLCSVRDEVPHSAALHLGRCVDEGPPRDRLDVGRLPTSEEND